LYQDCLKIFDVVLNAKDINKTNWLIETLDIFYMIIHCLQQIPIELYNYFPYFHAALIGDIPDDKIESNGD